MSRDELVGRVQALIEDVLAIEVPGPEVDLIDTGAIDSLALVTLITEIEHEFGFQLPLDDFDLDRFRSAALIADVVATAQAGSGVAS
jgi:D-alanine--poly(phosphoribitol) ligase subunit 2